MASPSVVLERAGGQLFVADITGYLYLLQAVAVARQDDPSADGAVADSSSTLRVSAPQPRRR